MLLTVRDIAARLHLSRFQVRALIKSGAIRAFRPAGTKKLLVLESDFEAWVHASRVAPKDGAQ